MNNLDWKLIQAYYDGEDAPIARLMEKYFERLFGISYYYVNDNEFPKDIIQEVALALISVPVEERKEKFKPERSNIFGALALRVKNKSIAFFRKKVREKELINGMEFQYEDSVDNDYLSKFDQNELRTARKTLTKIENKVLELELNGYKNDEIIAELDLTEEIRITKQRIKRKLKRELIGLRH